MENINSSLVLLKMIYYWLQKSNWSVSESEENKKFRFCQNFYLNYMFKFGFFGCNNYQNLLVTNTIAISNVKETYDCCVIFNVYKSKALN